MNLRMVKIELLPSTLLIISPQMLLIISPQTLLIISASTQLRTNSPQTDASHITIVPARLSELSIRYWESFQWRGKTAIIWTHVKKLEATDPRTISA